MSFLYKYLVVQPEAVISFSGLRCSAVNHSLFLSMNLTKLAIATIFLISHVKQLFFFFPDGIPFIKTWGDLLL